MLLDLYSGFYLLSTRTKAFITWILAFPLNSLRYLFWKPLFNHLTFSMTKLHAKNVFLLFHTNIFLLIKFQQQLTYWLSCNSLFNWKGISHYLLTLSNEDTVKKKFFLFFSRQAYLHLVRKKIFFIYFYMLLLYLSLSASLFSILNYKLPEVS